MLFILNHSFHSTATEVNFQLSLLLCSSTIHCHFLSTVFTDFISSNAKAICYRCSTALESLVDLFI